MLRQKAQAAVKRNLVVFMAIDLKVMSKAASCKQQLRITEALYGPELNKYDYKAIFS